MKASQFDSSSELINSTRQVSEATAPSGILVLESNPEVLEIWRRELGSLGYRPFVTADREEARRVLQSEHPAFLFCDVVEIFRNGRCILSSLLDLDPALPVIILTGLSTVEVAAEALRHGALFYVLRPITPDNLRLATEHGLARRKEKLLMPALERRQRWICGEIIVGTSDAVQEVWSSQEESRHPMQTSLSRESLAPERSCLLGLYTPPVTELTKCFSRWTAHLYPRTYSKLSFSAMKKVPSPERFVLNQG